MRIQEFKSHAAAAAPTSASPPDDVFVSYAELKTHGINYTRVHLRRLMSRGLFPANFQLSPNRCSWKLSDVKRWKASRPAAPAYRTPDP